MERTSDRLLRVVRQLGVLRHHRRERDRRVLRTVMPAEDTREADAEGGEPEPDQGEGVAQAVVKTPASIRFRRMSDGIRSAIVVARALWSIFA